MLEKALASIDNALEALSARLDVLSKSDAALVNPTLLGEIGRQMTILLETRRVTRREMAGDL